MAIGPHFGPRLGQRLDMRQSQSLVMTPQLRQAIKLLQFSNLEVAAFIDEEIERNPMLERDEQGDALPPERPALDQGAPAPDANRLDLTELASGGVLTTEALTAADGSYDPGGVADGAPMLDPFGGRGGSASFESDDRGIDDIAEGARTLREQLSEQVRLSFGDQTDRLIGASLIALLEPSGRLLADIAALATALGTDVARVERVRQAMMRFEPVGMFARDLKECLAVQLREKDRCDPAMQALLDNLDLLARRDMRGLMQLCGVDAADLADMVMELRRLDPKPGAGFDAPILRPILPDVLMRAAPNGEWLLELNPDTMPRLLVNHSFSARVMPMASREDKLFVAEKLQTANWLVKSLHQRAQTILKVASEIVRHQDGFFRHGVGYLRPLILREIAEAVELHESTVSRVTASKYIATPRGMFELKFFFTTAIAGTSGESHSAEAVRHRIRAMVAAEDADDVLSDDAIVAVLRREGVDIARRTVAKYRDALRIPSSVQRKREKAMSA